MESVFIDTFNALSSSLESNAIHILTHSKKNSEKIQSFTMQLVEFKYGLLAVIQTFIESQKQNSSKRLQSNAKILEEVRQELQTNRDKLHRYRLHQILKRKVERQKKQSMLGSSVLSDNQSTMQLEKSMVLIEKDLGIENQSDSITQRLGLSTVVSRSLLGQSTPARSDRSKDMSMMSEVQSLPIDDCSIDTQNMSESISKENLIGNKKQTSNQQALKKQESKEPKKVPSNAKKTKKTVFSKLDSGKQGLLGNLLQQSYASCVDKK